MRDREHPVLARDGNGKAGCGGEVELVLGEVHERQLVLLRECTGDLSLRHRAALNENLAQPPGARKSLLSERGLELELVDEAVAEESDPRTRQPRSCCPLVTCGSAPSGTPAR